ncbi:MAG: hypothetical protein QOJ12_1489 [Thermoleophilales bacterium]|nr:hypothetical protein [Thermoleophilales bacterium]
MPREEELAERLMERLMSDPAFRAEFRRDPIEAARTAGFDGLADDMLEAASAPLEGLAPRESRSSLAGALMAVAAEAVGVYDLAHGISRHVGTSPEQLRQNLASYTTPQGGSAAAPVDQYAGAQGGTTAPPPAQYAVPQDPNAARVQPAITPEDIAASQAQASAPPTATAASANQNVGAQVVNIPAVSSDQSGSGSGGASADQASSGSSSSSSADQVQPVAPAAKAEVIDPSQYGMAGGGGPESPEGVAVLNDKNITLDANGIADIKKGRMDPRLLSVLLEVSKDHKIAISATTSDHPEHTAGGSISNHWYGRGCDISMVDGQPVRPGNNAAHALALSLAKLPSSIRPTEVGSPWQLPGSADFSDAGHQNHIHVAFDNPISKSWTPPADIAGSNSASATPSTNGSVAPSDPAAVSPSAPATNMPAVPTPSTPADPAASAPVDPNVREDGGSGDTEAEANAESDGTGTTVGSGSGDTGDDSEDGPSNVGGDSSGSDDENDNTDGGGDPGDNAPPNPSNPSTPPSDAYLSSGSSSDSGSSDSVGSSNAADASSSSANTDSSGGASSNAADVSSGGGTTVDVYPGDNASSAKMAAWMATEAKKRGIPPELPVMAALVESNLRNLNYGDADSVGFFQMRVSIWNRGAYSGYPKNPKLQVQWFLDQAAAVQKQRATAGKSMDAAHYGDWIADIERPAAQYRGRYQLRLADARALLG